MITLLLLSQITRDEFTNFKRQVEVQFAEIRGEIKELKTEMRAEIQALNQRIDDLITYLWIFMGFITILIGFIIGWIWFISVASKEEIKSEIEIMKKKCFKYEDFRKL